MVQQLFILLIAGLSNTNSIPVQQLDFSKVKAFEKQLEDIMEIIDTIELKQKLNETEYHYQNDQSDLNKTRLGIVYHEVALNLSFFSKSKYQGYAQKSYDVLTELFNASETSPELLPFISSYRASALSLVSSETRKLKLLNKAFKQFEMAIEKYSSISYAPEFLRGSVAENLPWFFFSKRKYAKLDFESIINKQQKNPQFANDKIMSFTYWAWSNQHQRKKYRGQALAYLDKAIELDPFYEAGRARAERLKHKLSSD